MHHGIIIWDIPGAFKICHIFTSYIYKPTISYYIINIYKLSTCINLPCMWIEVYFLEILFGNRQFTCLYVYIYVEEVHWKAIRGIQYSLHTLIVYRQFTSMGDVPESRIWVSDSDLEWSLDVVAEFVCNSPPKWHGFMTQETAVAQTWGADG